MSIIHRASSGRNSKKHVKERLQYISERDEYPMENAYICRYKSSLGTPLSTDRSLCSYDMNIRGNQPDEDHESEPDRSNPMWKISSDIPQEEPDVVEEEVREEGPTLWEEIMEDYENERKELARLNMEAKPFEPELPLGSKLTAVQYLQKHIFPVLCPALEETLARAKNEECLQIQKCVFNGLDHISEILWNRNPMHPRRRKRDYTNIFDIPFVKIWLYYHPRPIYPLSWVWTKEEAITVMQTYIRRYFVCRDPDCYEMRKFWQVFKQEKKEEEYQRELEYLEEVREIATDIVNELVAMAVFSAEWNIHGCFCIAKPCHCDCKCFKWCKCCKCYREEKSVSERFYFPVGKYSI